MSVSMAERFEKSFYSKTTLQVVLCLFHMENSGLHFLGMTDLKNYRQLPILDNHGCFACGHTNSAGLRMEFFTDEETVYSNLTIPPHLCGWSNLTHGGIISTVLDEVMSWAAIYLLKKIILTKTISIDFIKPVFVGTELTAEGKILEVINEREAVMQGIIRNSETICAKSKGTFALLTPDTAIRLKVVDEKALKDIEPLFNA